MARMPKIIRYCKFCNIGFEIYKSKLSGKTNSSGNFCNRKCYIQHLKTIKGEAHKDYRKLSLDCSECGKEIKRTLARKNYYLNHFCGRICKYKFYSKYFLGRNNPFYKGGITPRYDFYLKNRYYKKSLKWCSMCGIKKHIHLHHIIPYRINKDNSDGNLIPLCWSCHRKVESIGNSMVESFSDKILGYKLFGYSLIDKRFTIGSLRDLDLI